MTNWNVLLSRPPLSSVVRCRHTRSALRPRCARSIDVRPTVSAAHPIRSAGIFTRQSTDIIAVADAEVSAAAAFIASHATENIHASNIVRSLAMARRSLELRFRKLLGRSILQEIQRVRVERVKHLSAETNLPMQTVAVRSGFSTPQRLSAVFRQVTGEPPMSYRERSRRAR